VRGAVGRTLKGASLLLLVLALANGCDDCQRIKNNIRLRQYDPCKRDSDCKTTCPQGVTCEQIPRQWGGLDHPVCMCRSKLWEPCDTTLDCKPQEWSAGCPPTHWVCIHYPGSSSGSCKCMTTCETDADCLSHQHCPQNDPICEQARWGDKNICKCESDNVDGGDP
jgi:hypothetical protein